MKLIVFTNKLLLFTFIFFISLNINIVRNDLKKMSNSFLKKEMRKKDDFKEKEKALIEKLEKSTKTEKELIEKIEGLLKSITESKNILQASNETKEDEKSRWKIT